MTAAMAEVDGPKFIECPFGCGLKYFAEDQPLTVAEFWRYGPWRMSVHTCGRTPGDGSRCVRPLYDARPYFTVPRLDEHGQLIDDTEEGN